MKATKTYAVAFLGLILAAAGALKASDSLTEGLAGWWSFADGFGVTANDQSGNNLNGLLAGAASFVMDDTMGGAAEFFGASGSVTVPHSAALEPATGTVAVWVNWSKRQAADVLSKPTSRLVRSGQNGRNFAYALRIENNGMVTAMVCNDDPNSSFPHTILHSSGGAVKAGNWHHLAMRWDGSVLSLFVDGRLAAATSYSAVPETGLSYGGANALTFAEPLFKDGDRLEFYGRLADARIFSRPLGEAEIATLFAGKTGTASGAASKGGGKKK